MIIDTHCHLDDNRYKDDLDEVIKRAFEGGVGGAIIPGADPKDLKRAKEISYQYQNIYFASGVHPYEIDNYKSEEIEEFLQDEKCIAVGECGLDYYRLPKEENRKREIKEKQKEVFISQIELAIKYQKPLIVHIRDANSDSLEILKEYGDDLIGGVLHCYNASEILLELAEKNFYFGIGGVLTFKNAKKLVEILPKIPKERLLLETDAPYLTPHPFRGQRNEPLYTKYILRKMSEIVDIEKRELEELILKNTERLFKVF